MSARRDPGRQLLLDVVKAKRQRDEAREDVARVSRVLEEQRAELITVKVRGRLRHLEDFDRLVGIENVLDADGRIDDEQLEVRLAALLIRRPELAAPRADVGGRR